MNLEHIDIRAQPLHTAFNRVEDVLPRQPDSVHERAIVRRNRRNRWLRARRVDAEVAL
jgi:hypothetical protein